MATYEIRSIQKLPSDPARDVYCVAATFTLDDGRVIESAQPGFLVDLPAGSDTVVFRAAVEAHAAREEAANAPAPEVPAGIAALVSGG